MKSLGRQVAWMVLAVAECAFCLPEPAGADTLPQSALVVVVSRFFEGERAGNGFIVGDGTLVVTGEHLLYEKSEKGGHRLEGFVTVFSPYLGEAWDARILASDEELDWAVLEVPGRGHPSLSLADANAVMDARSARVLGLPAVVQRLDDWGSADSPEDFAVHEEELPVAYVGVRGRVPLFITLSGATEVGPGWSGSPIVLPGTSAALGCFTMVRSTSRYEQTFRREAAGPVTSQVLELLGGGFDRGRLRLAGSTGKHPEDAHEACSQALRASSLLRADRYESALEPTRAFLRLRPGSACGHKMLACVNDKLGRRDAARESYRRAVELDPNSLSGKLLYAQFLAGNGDPNGAMRILEPLWQAGRSRGLVAVAMVSLLSERNELSRSLTILEEGDAVRAEERLSLAADGGVPDAITGACGGDRAAGPGRGAMS